jgi:DNA-binding response OmpR family regulator
MTGPPARTGIRVAIIEDEREIRECLTVLINGTEGFACTGSYRSMEDALDRISRQLPDVVLSDIGLPGMSGIEACRAIRSQAGGDTLQIAALTGWGQEEDQRRSRAAGFDAHLVKPVERSALLALLSAAR